MQISVLVDTRNALVCNYNKFIEINSRGKKMIKDKIDLFDSGIGGVTVLKELLKIM